MEKNEKLGLAALLFISILLSIYLYFKTYIISIDGAFQYIPIAKDFASGLFRKAFSHNQQPLYSLIIAVVYKWVPDFETAGKLVSSVFGILMVLPVYFLGKRIFDKKIAFLSSLLLIIHPYIRIYSADVLKESTYLFFLGTAVWFAWKAIQEEKWISFLFIPLFSVLVYLVRPDGIEVLLLVFFYALFIKKFSVRGRKGIILILLILSSIALLLPYLIYIKGARGEWTFGKAKSVMEMLGWGETNDTVPFTHKILFSLKVLNSDMLHILHPGYILLLLIGFVKKISTRFKKGEGFLLSFCILHYMVLFLMVLNTTKWGTDKTVQAVSLSGRHLLPILLFSIYWVGEGFMAVFQWVCKKAEFSSLFSQWDQRKKTTMIYVALFILIAAIILPKTLKAHQRYDRLPEKWAGIWIKNQYGRGLNIYSSLPQVIFYADGEGGRYVNFQKYTMDQIEASMAEGKVLFLVVREEEKTRYPEVEEVLQRDFIELAKFGGDPMEKIIVYKMVQ